MLPLPSICPPERKNTSMRPWPAQSKSSRPPSETMSPAAQQRYVGPPMATLTRQQCGGSGNWRGCADRDVTGIADEASNDVSKQLFVAKRLQGVTRRVGH